MAIRGAARWKPDMYRSTINTTIQDFDPTSTPPSGGVVMIAQAVAYDDTVVTGANYAPGDPATERNLVVLYEEPIVIDLVEFDGMTNTQAADRWASELTAFKDRVLPAGAVLVKAIRAARIAPPIIVE